jgi:hypothetical protein
MTNLQELIETAQRLSSRLETAANDERRFCIDVQMKLESLSWEILRTANELNEIKYYVG